MAREVPGAMHIAAPDDQFAMIDEIEADLDTSTNTGKMIALSAIQARNGLILNQLLATHMHYNRRKKITVTEGPNFLATAYIDAVIGLSDEDDEEEFDLEPGDGEGGDEIELEEGSGES